jgi:archaellum component FlaF (FlaF/FlaG flagellin family)
MKESLARSITPPAVIAIVCALVFGGYYYAKYSQAADACRIAAGNPNDGGVTTAMHKRCMKNQGF